MIFLIHPFGFLFTNLSRQTVTLSEITLTAVQYGSVSDHLLYSACGLVDLKVFFGVNFIPHMVFWFITGSNTITSLDNMRLSVCLYGFMQGNLFPHMSHYLYHKRSVNKRVCVKESKPTPLKYLTPGCLIEKAGFLSEDVCRVSCPLPTLPHCPQCWTLVRLPSDSLIVTLLLFPSLYPPAHPFTLLLHPFLTCLLASSTLHSPNT